MNSELTSVPVTSIQFYLIMYISGMIIVLYDFFIGEYRAIKQEYKNYSKSNENKANEIKT